MKLAIVAVVLAAAFVGSLWLWLYVFNKDDRPGTTPDEIESWCKDFEEPTAFVSCQEAIGRALAARPGTIQEISVGSPLLPDPSLRFWLIDIKLRETVFHETFQRTITYLRIGIPFIDAGIGIFEEPLDI